MEVKQWRHALNECEFIGWTLIQLESFHFVGLIVSPCSVPKWFQEFFEWCRKLIQWSQARCPACVSWWVYFNSISLDSSNYAAVTQLDKKWPLCEQLACRQGQGAWLAYSAHDYMVWVLLMDVVRVDLYTCHVLEVCSCKIIPLIIVLAQRCNHVRMCLRLAAGTLYNLHPVWLIVMTIIHSLIFNEWCEGCLYDWHGCSVVCITQAGFHPFVDLFSSSRIASLEAHIEVTALQMRVQCRCNSLHAVIIPHGCWCTSTIRCSNWQYSYLWIIHHFIYVVKHTMHALHLTLYCL